jgi:V8-like Glu-specific endopeptidase
MILSHSGGLISRLSTTAHKSSAYPAVFPLSDNGKMKEGVATLIHKKWAVTAAHCAVDLYKADFENCPFLVRIGGKENIVDRANKFLKQYLKYAMATQQWLQLQPKILETLALTLATKQMKQVDYAPHKSLHE